ncbi:hypothetical protein NQ318_015544 [Aromia moschata]|uniref:Uncharacterized protein n=1 Tax=Aromia moschata TaxID=1265417 RepID=A0AAV8Y8C0_9CUCU|nr:hypothetical protein NQ318_015544 [Aromia moschata]
MCVALETFRTMYLNRGATLVKTWEVLTDNTTGSDNALDALTLGCNVCEHEGCGTSVGYGGSPDENGETTLDALIFDGDTMDMGAIGCLRRVKTPLPLLESWRFSHRIFESVQLYRRRFTNQLLFDSVGDLEENGCQPNFWKDDRRTNDDDRRSVKRQKGERKIDDRRTVRRQKDDDKRTETKQRGVIRKFVSPSKRIDGVEQQIDQNVEPNSSASCGPYTPSSIVLNTGESRTSSIGEDNHDTIGMIVISGTGHVVAGTSTNGLTYKIPGFLAVEQLRLGSTPTQAANMAISRIVEKYPFFSGALIVADNEGNVGAACNGMTSFPFIVANEEYPEGDLRSVDCTLSTDSGNSAVTYESICSGQSIKYSINIGTVEP